MDQLVKFTKRGEENDEEDVEEDDVGEKTLLEGRGREGKGSKVVFYVAIFQATPIVMQLLVSFS